MEYILLRFRPNVVHVLGGTHHTHVGRPADSHFAFGGSMFKQISIAAAAVAALGAGPAFAVPMYDQDITPDVIFGSGNANGAWTVERTDNVEVGLRAKVRGANVFNSNGDGSYNHESGFSSGSAAKWNFEFSVNLNADGTSNPDRLFDDVTVMMAIDTDPSAGISWVPFPPLMVWIDNAYGTNATANGAGADDLLTNFDFGVSDGNYVVQNSQNVGWMGLGIDVTIPATYEIGLAVLSGSLLPGIQVESTPIPETLLAMTTITVLVDGGGASVPEPATLGLLGFGLLGFGYARRRRKA